MKEKLVASGFKAHQKKGKENVGTAEQYLPRLLWRTDTILIRLLKSGDWFTAEFGSIDLWGLENLLAIATR
jgi:hypothetical protein